MPWLDALVGGARGGSGAEVEPIVCGVCIREKGGWLLQEGMAMDESERRGVCC